MRGGGAIFFGGGEDKENEMWGGGYKEKFLVKSTIIICVNHWLPGFHRKVVPWHCESERRLFIFERPLFQKSFMTLSFYIRIINLVHAFVGVL